MKKRVMTVLFWVLMGLFIMSLVSFVVFMALGIHGEIYADVLSITLGTSFVGTLGFIAFDVEIN